MVKKRILLWLYNLLSRLLKRVGVRLGPEYVTRASVKPRVTFPRVPRSAYRALQGPRPLTRARRQPRYFRS